MKRKVYHKSHGISKIVIYRPSGFGKSVNLNMPMDLLEEEIRTSGEMVDLKSIAKYRLFTENNLQIGTKTDFINNCFERYPTLCFNFRGLDVSSYDEFLVSFREMVGHEFVRHKYLLSLTALNEIDVNAHHFYADAGKSKKLSDTKLK